MALFDPGNPEDVQRLKQAILSSQEDLVPLLAQRQQCLLSYQGHRFSPGLASGGARSLSNAEPRLSIPLMGLAIDLHEQLLSGEEVRAVVSPSDPDLKVLASTIKGSLDLLTQAINLSQTFQNWVKESLWGWGVAKVGMSFQRGHVNGKGGGFNRKFSIPFVDIIDSRDLLVDTKASSWNRKRWIGNRYLVPLEWARETKAFDASARKDLREVDPQRNRLHGDSIASSSPVPRNVSIDSFVPYTELQDVYLPLDGLVLTMSPNGPKDVLAAERFNGPSVGPYHLLGYEFVPDTVVPMPMAWAWIDAHVSANTVWDKALRQALRSKRNPIFPPGLEKEADRLRLAEDGEWIAAKMELVQTFSIPGTDPSLLNLVGQLINLFSFMAGNMNLLGGLSAQSETLGQDRLLQGSGTRRMAELQRRSQMAFSDVLRSLAWYLFEQEGMEVNVQRQVRHMTVNRTLEHEDVKGRFLEFNFSVEAIRHKSPDERLGLLLRWIREVVIPLQGQAAIGAQGIDMKALHEIGRDIGDIPELDRVIKDLGAQPSPDEMQAITGRGSRAPGGAAGGGGQGQSPGGELSLVGGGNGAVQPSGFSP